MDNLRTGIAVAIAVVWIGLFGRVFITGSNEYPPAEFSAVMLAAATYLFGSELRDVVKKKANGDTG